MNPSGGNWAAAKSGADSAPNNPVVADCPAKEPRISVSWRDYDFDRVRKGKDPAPTHDLVITSTGTDVLSSITVTIGGDQFQIAGGSASLQPGADATVTVTFKPTSLGEKSATIQVTSNAVNENPIAITVKGKPFTVITFVVEEEGPPVTKLENVKLKIKQAGEAEAEVTTDVAGKVEVETEKDGNFEVMLGDFENVLEFRSLTTA